MSKISLFCYEAILLIIILTCLNRLNAIAQPTNPDSLKSLLSSADEDTATANRLIEISLMYYNINTDSALLYADKSFEISEKAGYTLGEAKSLYCQALANSFIGNNPKALQFCFNSLKLFEDTDNKEFTCDCLSLISSLYDDMNDPRKALDYAAKAYAIAREIKSVYYKFNTAWDIGFYLCELNLPDSALFFFQQSYQEANATAENKDQYLGQAFGGLGLVNDYLGNEDIALPYLYKSIHYSKSAMDAYSLMFNYDFIANLYMKIHQNDSSILYFEKELEIANQLQYVKRKLDIYKSLAKLYESKSPQKTIGYFQLEALLRDSLYSAEKNWEVQNLTFNEEERQKELKTKNEEEAQKRKNNIQYETIAIALCGFIILFLLLSRSIVVNEKVIEFLGVIGLLILFELLNLLLHPFLDDITNHSPLLMLLALVCVAALIVPAHHRLEKYIIQKMVEKNKKIRLEAAKKTIARLETDTDLAEHH